MAGQSNSIQQQDTLNRYLLYFPRNKTVLSDVLSFRGEEELSKPYCYTIRFTSPVPDIAVNDVLNQMAEFILRAPNPKAGWHNQEPWLPVRQINGVITSFTRIQREVFIPNRSASITDYLPANLSIPQNDILQ